MEHKAAALDSRRTGPSSGATVKKSKEPRPLAAGRCVVDLLKQGGGALLQVHPPSRGRKGLDPRIAKRRRRGNWPVTSTGIWCLPARAESAPGGRFPRRFRSLPCRAVPPPRTRFCSQGALPRLRASEDGAQAKLAPAATSDTPCPRCTEGGAVPPTRPEKARWMAPFNARYDS